MLEVDGGDDGWENGFLCAGSKLRTSEVGKCSNNLWNFVLQKVVCLWLFTRNPSGFLWSSLKNCEISRQMLV